MSKNTKTRMIPAVIDQVLMWIVVFMGFVTIFFLVVDYSSIVRIKGNIDLMSEYAAKMIALGKDTEDISTRLNNMKSGYFAEISGANITCNITTTGSYQVIFNLTGSYIDTRIMDAQNSIVSKRVVFNEMNSDEIECSLTLTKQ